MKSKIGKILTSSLLAVSMIASALPLSVSAVTTGTKSGNINKDSIKSNVKTAHDISIANEANGWTVGGEQASVESLKEAKVLKTDTNGNYTNSDSVSKYSDLQKQLSKAGTPNNYHYVLLNNDVSLENNITIKDYTILLITKDNTLDLNNHNLNLNGNNILVTGEGSDSSTIKNGQIIVNKVDAQNIAIKSLKLTNGKLTNGKNYEINQNVNKILFNESCSNVSIIGCALNNNSTDSSNSFGGRILCNASVTDLYIVNCSAAGSSPYLLRTSSSGSINNLKITKDANSSAKLSKQITLRNSKNIKITNIDSLNYYFTKCNTITFSNDDYESIVNNITFNKCNNFRLRIVNVEGNLAISSCDHFSLMNVIVNGTANIKDSYFFETARATNDACLTNIFESGLGISDCRNFILDEAKIPIGLTIKNTTSNEYKYFSIIDSYINNVTISNMKGFTIYKTCKKTTAKNYNLSNCSYYKNYVVRTNLTSATTHSH